MRKLIWCFTAASLLLSASAFAAIDDNTIMSEANEFALPDTAKISVTPGSKVSITVLKGDATLEEFMGSDNPALMAAGYKQVTADENGDYSVSLDFGGVSGDYSVYTGAIPAKASDNKPVVHLSKIKFVNKTQNEAQTAKFKEELEKAELDKNAVVTLLETCSADLGVSGTLSDLASETDLERAVDIIVASGKEADISSDRGIAATLDKAIAIALFEAGKMSPVGDNMLFYNVPQSVSECYEDEFMTKDVKEFIEDSLDKKNDTFEKFDKNFAEATALGVIYGADGAGAVEDFLYENADILDIPKDKVTLKFAESIVGEKFSSMDATGIEDFKEPESTLKPSRPTGGGGGGGGSSTGKSGVKIDPPEKAPAEPVDTTAPGFTDMDGFEWAQEAVEGLRAKGVLDGKSDGIFAPGDRVLREEFVKMILTAVEFEKMYGTVSFEDVPEEAWFYEYVKDAYLSGVVNGISDTMFGSGQQIIRQDMAVMCYNALKQKGVFSKSLTTNDVDFVDKEEIDDYAKNAVKMLSGLGIITGDQNGEFKPMDYANRAEAAQMIYRAMALTAAE